MALDIKMSRRLSWVSVAHTQRCGLGLDSHEIRYIHCADTLFAGDKMKTAKLFHNGQSQAVRLPKEFRFEGREVFIKKSGRSVILIPQTHSWDSLIGSLDKFSPDYMTDRDQPEPQRRAALFE